LPPTGRAASTIHPRAIEGGRYRFHCREYPYSIVAALKCITEESPCRVGVRSAGHPGAMPIAVVAGPTLSYDRRLEP